MPPRISEQLTIFVSIIKWSVLASAVGMLSAIGTATFLNVLSMGRELSEGRLSFQVLLPASLLASSALVRFLAADAAGHGTEKVIEAVHQKMGNIQFKIVPVKLLATVLTLAGGGSAGKEGPCAQIGAGLASAFGNILRMSDVDRRKLVICGISAGFSAVFGTPIAGALFGIEVLVLGQMMYDVLFPSFVAGIVGYHAATLLGISYPVYPHAALSTMNGFMFLKMLLLGFWCGVIALFFIQMQRLVKKAINRWSWSWVYKSLAGGIYLVLIGVLVNREYLGLGLEYIDKGIRGEVLPAFAVFWKSLATAITLESGGSGGVITPIFFIGTSAGNLFATWFDPQHIAAFSSVGMVALLAGAANTPISASVMAMELFGPEIGPYAAVACMTSFLSVGYHSVYPSQVLGVQKSSSLSAPTGSQLGDITRAELISREKSLLRWFSSIRKDRKND